MPSEKMNIIYCTEVDANGRILNSSMLIHNNVSRLVENAAELFQNRKGH